MSPIPTFGAIMLGELLAVVAVLAQAAPDVNVQSWVQIMLQVGVAAYMIWWFSARMERHMEAMYRAQDRATRARMLEFSIHRSASTEAREEAKTIIAEIDAERKPSPS